MYLERPKRKSGRSLEILKSQGWVWNCHKRSGTATVNYETAKGGSGIHKRSEKAIGGSETPRNANEGSGTVSGAGI